MESTSLVVMAFRWRKPLAILPLIAALGSFIFSAPAFITPKYKSSVVFFPPATNSLSRALLNENSTEKQDILAFGAEEEAEQILQLLNSDVIREKITTKFKLMEHYGISPDDNYPMSTLTEEYKENITFSRTEFMSVRIDVLDTDPQMAADIANEIAALLDSTKNNIQKARAEEALSIVEAAYQEKSIAISQKEDSLNNIRSHGIFDYTNQSAIWSEEYAKSFTTYNNEKAALEILEKHHGKNSADSSVVNTRARIAGAAARINAVQRKMNELAAFGGASVSLSEQLEIDRKDQAKLKEQLDKLRIDTRNAISNKFVVNEATKAERKTTPVRWLIVLLSTAGTFILTFIGLLFLERIRSIEL